MMFVLAISALGFGCQHQQGTVEQTQDTMGPKQKRYAQFEDLRAAFLSNAQHGKKRSDVETHVGIGTPVRFANRLWESPRVAFSYVAQDRPAFHYVVVYDNDVVVEQCGYTVGQDGKPSILMP